MYWKNIWTFKSFWIHAALWFLTGQNEYCDSWVNFEVDVQSQETTYNLIHEIKVYTKLQLVLTVQIPTWLMVRNVVIEGMACQLPSSLMAADKPCPQLQSSLVNSRVSSKIVRHHLRTFPNNYCNCTLVIVIRHFGKSGVKDNDKHWWWE